jgi:hypothetical protein
MDAIKGKMVKLSTETETATARANRFDAEAIVTSKECVNSAYIQEV